jgi:MFS family permease
MITVLRNPIYAKLFTAQVVALLGTGLLTVALGLVAYDLAGDKAGVVLGIALTLKMVAYVGFSPIANALFARLDRRRVLIGADLVRAVIALFLPFVDQIWQIYGLVFLLQAASATFTPAFQAVIPDILPDEDDYTKALSMSRLAYDLENIVSPALAGFLLTVISYHWLFIGTSIGFFGSIALILMTTLPARKSEVERGFVDRLTRGSRIYLATPRLRGLLALNFGATAVGAVVIVNSVVIVRGQYAGAESDVAWALGAFGLGSMISALALPGILQKFSDRGVMFTGSVLAAGLIMGFGAVISTSGWVEWPVFLAVWAFSGLFYAAILTPSGRLLRRSSKPDDRAALFAAQFALSHACWLITYPLAGFLGSIMGFGSAMLWLGGLGFISILVGLLVWPREAKDGLAHSHPEMTQDHPHLAGAVRKTHRHIFVIDDEHKCWPTNG